MAQRKTKTTSKKSASRKSGSANRSASWLARFSRTQLIVISIFVLAFASVGSWMLYNSYAATWYCTAHQYYQYEPGTYHGYCVYQIQDAIRTFGYYPTINNRTMQNVAYDGIYGPGTAAGVKAFQAWWNTQQKRPTVLLYPDGVVGSATWNAICPALQRIGFNDIYNNLGCYHVPYGSARV